MLTRVQLRASGETAHEVEHELVWAAGRIIETFGLEAEATEQVIEGTPGKSFDGRLTLKVLSIIEPDKTSVSASITTATVKSSWEATV